MPPNPLARLTWMTCQTGEVQGGYHKGNSKLAKWAGNKLEDWGDQPDLLAFGPVIGIARPMP